MGFVLASPLIGLAALATKLGDGGPVLYRQTRVGRDGVDFDVLKLRTMVVGAERMGANTLLLNMNVGAMAHDVFLEQIRRFGKEVLPRLQAHQVRRVPAAETVPA